MANIQKANRVRISTLEGVKTIYLSNKMMAEIRPYVIKLESVTVPKKTESQALTLKLMQLAENYPEHFAPSSLLVLGA